MNMCVQEYFGCICYANLSILDKAYKQSLTDIIVDYCRGGFLRSQHQISICIVYLN